MFPSALSSSATSPSTEQPSSDSSERQRDDDPLLVALRVLNGLREHAPERITEPRRCGGPQRRTDGIQGSEHAPRHTDPANRERDDGANPVEESETQHDRHSVPFEELARALHLWPP